jgi:hypothetical protein
MQEIQVTPDGEIIEVVDVDEPVTDLEPVPELTAKSVLQMLIPIYTEIEMLQADAKAILAGAKEAGLPHSLLAKIAKAKVKDQLQDLEEVTEELLDLIEAVS